MHTGYKFVADIAVWVCCLTSGTVGCSYEKEKRGESPSPEFIAPFHNDCCIDVLAQCIRLAVHSIVKLPFFLLTKKSGWLRLWSVIVEDGRVGMVRGWE